MNARARVERLLSAANHVFGANRRGDLVERLAYEAGLHPRVVADALDHSLELQPTHAELDALVRRAVPRPATVVSLSANVFIAPLRAIAWALASSEDVRVRPSRRARAFVDALFGAAPGLYARIEDGQDAHASLLRAIECLPPSGAVHAYGSDAGLEALAPSVGSRPFERHGPGFGAIALRAPPDARTAEALARDTAAFDQRGCLSPRIVFVEGDSTQTADRLHEALESLSVDLPPTPDPAMLGALARAADAARMIGRALRGTGSLVLDLGTGAPFTLAPGGRSLTVHAVADAAKAIAALGLCPTIVATDDATLALPPGVRRSRPGEMQRPPLDGPVDLRALAVEERE